MEKKANKGRIDIKNYIDEFNRTLEKGMIYNLPILQKELIQQYTILYNSAKKRLKLGHVMTKGDYTIIKNTEAVENV